MAAPLFYHPELQQDTVQLDETASKHMIGVLRMEKGEEIQLTDGKGLKVVARITDDNRKKASVQVINRFLEKERAGQVSIAISLIKNTSRFEWFLEKVTEMGVHEIIPLLCERTEKEKFRFDRLQSILISAMLQSEQSWLPRLHEPVEFKELLTQNFNSKFIAHCLPEEKTSLREYLSQSGMDKASHSVIAIGPEGDFTPKEIKMALEYNFMPVTLGNTRLRTETAGVVATALLIIR